MLSEQQQRPGKRVSGRHVSCAEQHRRLADELLVAQPAFLVMRSHEDGEHIVPLLAAFASSANHARTSASNSSA